MDSNPHFVALEIRPIIKSKKLVLVMGLVLKMPFSESAKNRLNIKFF